MKEQTLQFNASLAEADRQLTVCNACRYCEGFCAVFPAVHSQRAFASGDITQFANLCHNCRGCYYACQYTEPHEFAINLPRALANVRTESWQQFILPSRVAGAFQYHGVAIAGVLVTTIALLFYLLSQWTPGNGEGFYAYLSHTMMVLLFLPAFIVPLVVIAFGIRRYWQTVDGQAVRLTHLRKALADAASLRNLGGGQQQGCNYEEKDRYTNTRRWYHQATMYGFLLCFLSTSSATVMHYGLGLEAPYALLSLPKLLGITGGFLLTVGCAGLAYLKTRADPSLGAGAASHRYDHSTGHNSDHSSEHSSNQAVGPSGNQTDDQTGDRSTRTVVGGEMAFVLLLGATGLTGLLLYVATGTTWVPTLLAIHLGTVLAFFITMPYSKMVHGFFRLAALVRDAQR